MKNIFVKSFTALTLLFVGVSCSEVNDNPSELAGAEDTMTISATAGSATKTILNDDLSVSWCKGDMIAIFNESGSPVIYTSSLEDSYAVTADFNGKIIDKSGDLYAIYPYNGSYSADYEAETVTFSLSSSKTYTEGTFASGANPTVASSSSKEFSFVNLCGALELSLKGDQTVTGITVTSESDNLNGTVTVDMSTQTISAIDGSSDTNKSVTMSCAVELSADEDTSFIIIVPPTESALTVTIALGDGSEQVLEIPNIADNYIVAGSITKMPTVECNRVQADGARITNKPGTDESNEMYNVFAVDNIYTLEWEYTSGGSEAISWISSDESVATVDASTGVVNFLAEGVATIKLLSDGIVVDDVELEVDAEYIRQEYDYDGDSQIIEAMETASGLYTDKVVTSIENGWMSVTLAEHSSGNGKYRATFRKDGLEIDLDTYPILAVKMQYLRYMYSDDNNGVGRKIKFYTADYTSGIDTTLSTLTGWTTSITDDYDTTKWCSFSLDITNTLLYSSGVAASPIGRFEFKIADITADESGEKPVTKVDWIRSFKSEADLQTFLQRTGDL
ncbi:MAG: DUF4979 domain-containing protein [Rikenellaceae bacterium]